MADNRTNGFFSDSKLDQLWQSVRSYRSCKNFKAVMDACARFRHLAPYNAMLVELQRPNAMYMLSEKEWQERFDRGIKPNSRPLIILVPFGPVDYLFDISDTYNMGTRLIPLTDEDILEELAAPYKTKHNVSDGMLNKFMSKLALYGIAIDNSFIAGASYAARIELLLSHSHDIIIPIGNNTTISRRADFLLSVNKNAENGERFASICHELGHLFCFHLISPDGWEKWQYRGVPNEAQEFEAEAVSWLICERLGIGNPSDKYLSNFLSQNEEIPSRVSMERILAAANTIWNLCSQRTNINYKNGWLYKYNKDFKEQVKLLKQNEK